MRERAGDSFGARISDMENRLTVIETGHGELKSTVEAIKSDTDDILAAVRGASRVGHFVKKHGPRLFAFSMGSLVTAGYVDPKIAKGLLTVFGLA